MKVALERFLEPSRRYTVERIGEPGNAVAWSLANVFDRPGLLREVPGALGKWFRLEAPPGTRRRLLRACLETRGARLGAFLDAPDLWRSVQEGKVDRIA